MARRRSHHGNPTKTIGTAYIDYVRAIAFAWKYGNYQNAMAKFFGVDPSKIANATPVLDWNRFAMNVLTYAKSWAQRFAGAYGLEVPDNTITTWNSQIPQQVQTVIQQAQQALQAQQAGGAGAGGAVVGGGGAVVGGGGV